MAVLFRDVLLQTPRFGEGTGQFQGPGRLLMRPFWSVLWIRVSGCHEVRRYMPPEGFPDMHLGIHLCRGNYVGSRHFSEGAYDNIAKKLFQVSLMVCSDRRF